MIDLMFLWLADVHGDSKDPRHLGEFDVEGYFNEPGPRRYMSKLKKPGPDMVMGSCEVALKNDRPDFQKVLALAITKQTIRTAVLSIEKNFAGRSFGLKVRYRMDDVTIFDMPRSDALHKISEFSLGYKTLYVTKY